MPVELGSFDVIIGMDWLAKYHALIICDEKVVRILYGNEVLIIQGDSCDSGSKLNIISCTKTQKYIEKGCQVYLAQVTTKKAEDKAIAWVTAPLDQVGISNGLITRFAAPVVSTSTVSIKHPARTKLQSCNSVAKNFLTEDLFKAEFLPWGSNRFVRKTSQRQHLGLAMVLRVSKYAVWFWSKSTSSLQGLMSGYNFLGHVIDVKALTLDPAKIDGNQWIMASPKTPTVILSILRCWPKKREIRNGGEKRQNAAFQVVEAKAVGLGCGLFDAERDVKVIALIIPPIKCSRENYTQRDLELGAVVFALKMWRHYLYGTKCVVFTDHKSLQPHTYPEGSDMWSKDVGQRMGQDTDLGKSFDRLTNSAYFLAMREDGHLEDRGQTLARDHPRGQSEKNSSNQEPISKPPVIVKKSYDDNLSTILDVRIERLKQEVRIPIVKCVELQEGPGSPGERKT
ncbi:putative reverse transcriptase domain-containing protein [Tanacetum coccineum]